VNDYQSEELLALGIRSVGENVKIHRSVLFFEPDRITIGSNVRIDAYTVVTGSLKRDILIGNHVHVGVGTFLCGGGGITIEDFVSVSARVMLFSTSDTRGAGLLGPVVPEELRSPVFTSRIVLRKHAAIGAGSVVLPGVKVGLGALIGPLCIVKRSVEPFAIMSGRPLRKVAERDRSFLELEQRLVAPADLTDDGFDSDHDVAKQIRPTG
jgi:galactoside O-acetyltransferase